MLSLDINKTKDVAVKFQKDNLTLLIEGRKNVIGKGISIELSIKPKNKGKKLKVNRKLKVNKKEKKLLEYWLTDKNLEELILLSPKNQKELINKIKIRYHHIHDKRTRLYWFIRTIFTELGYEKLETKDKKLFFEKLKIKTCTYCNRNYIFNVKESGHFKGHIDHFYPKGLYPYLAMSFYNFIPICGACNYIKGEFDTSDEKEICIHPYERKDEKVIGTTLSHSVNNLSYQFKKDALLEKLFIEDMYNKGHKDIIQELYFKFFLENTKEHFDLLEKSLGTIGFKEDEIHRFLTCGYSKHEDQHKRSFSKAIKDIKDEFESL